MRVRTESAGLRGLALRRRADTELIDAAVAGDPVAFSEVYRRFHTPVYAFCLSRLMKPTLAEDASQEVFVRLLSAKSGTIEKPLSWLYGVARNVCIDVAKRDAREFSTDFEHLSVVDPFDTVSHVTAREDGERIVIALKGLNPRYRAALVMHEMHAQSASDIAKAFGLGLGATYTLMSRARDAFDVSYAKAEILPAPCKHALNLIYRREAEGVTETEEMRLEQHLAECASCARESRRVARARQWSMVRTALTVPALGHAWTRVAHRFEPLSSVLAPEASHSAMSSLGAAAAALALGTAAVLGSVVTIPDKPPVPKTEFHTVAAHPMVELNETRAYHQARAAEAGSAAADRLDEAEQTQKRARIGAADGAGAGDGSGSTGGSTAKSGSGAGSGTGGGGSGATADEGGTNEPRRTQEPAADSGSGADTGGDGGGSASEQPKSGSGTGQPQSTDQGPGSGSGR